MRLFAGKKVSKNYKSNFFTFFSWGKKGMEMWQLMLLILATLVLVFFVFWYSGLNDVLGNLLDKLG